MEALQHLVQMLPTANRDTLHGFLHFLANVASKSADHRAEERIDVINVIRSMIDFYKEIFEVWKLEFMHRSAITDSSVPSKYQPNCWIKYTFI